MFTQLIFRTFRKMMAMKNFKMRFAHPVKGVLRLFKTGGKCAEHVILVDTKESILVNISLAAIPRGAWNLVLNWEFEEKQYSYSRMIAIS